MFEILKESAATEDSGRVTVAGDTVSRLVFQVVDADEAWEGTLKVGVRVLDSGAAGVEDVVYPPIRDRSDESVILGATGITEPGTYEIDATGVELVFEHTRTAGALSVYGQAVRG